MKVNLLKKINVFMYFFILLNNIKKYMIKFNDEDEIKLYVFY